MARLPGSKVGIEQLGPTSDEIVGQNRQIVSAASLGRKQEVPKRSGTLPASLGTGQKVANAIASQQGIGLPQRLPVPAAPKLPPEQLPPGSNRIPSLAEVNRDERVRLSEQGQDIMERARVAASASGEAPGDEAAEAGSSSPSEAPGDAAERDEKMRDVERAVAEADLANMLAAQVSRMPEAQRALVHPERRRRIEDLLEPMNVEDLIITGSVQQRIPIIPGKYEMTLRLPKQHEILFCLKFMQKQTGSDAYIENLYNLSIWTCATVQIGEKILTNHLSDEGSFDEEVNDAGFLERMGFLLSQAAMVIADIGVQYDWFLKRASSLLVGDALKNG